MQKPITKKVILMLLFFFCTISAVFSQTYVNKEWSINDGTPLMLQWSNSLRTTSGLITVGNTQVAGQGANILLTKYTSTGGIAWSVNYNTGSTKNDYGTNLVQDTAGNIYVCGMTDNNGISNYDIVVLKYNNSGTLLWDTTYNSPYNLNDFATSIIIDPSNNIYIAGSSEGSTTQFDFIALKYNNSGVYQWVSRYDYTNLQDYGGQITLNSTNTNLYVTGASASSATNWDYTSVKYDLSGSQIAVVRNSVAGSGYDQPYAYAKDNSGNMYITGKGSTNGTDYDMKTIKLTPALAIAWDVSFNKAGLEDVGNAIAVDNNSDILVGGYTTSSINQKEAKLIKYDNNGNQLWKYERHSDFPTGNAEVKAIDIDGSNNVFICVENQGNSSKDVAVIKLKANGSLLWEKRIQTNHDETPTGIKVESDGSVYVTYVEDLGVSNTYTVVKYNDYKMDTSRIFVDTVPVCMKRQLIVKFTKGTLDEDAIDNTLGNAEIEFASLDYFLKPSPFADFQNAISDLCNEQENNTCYITATRVFPAFKTTDLTSVNRQGQNIPIPDYWTTLLLELPVNIDIKDVMERLYSSGNVVDYCEPNIFLRPFSGANDTYYGTVQHSLHPIGAIYNNGHINLEPAWDIEVSGGKKFVKVGVIDGDACWQHEDFGYDGIDPATSKMNGWNFVVNSNIKNDTANQLGLGNHGTQCLSVIGAIRNNSIGIAGIAGGNYVGVGNHNDDGVALYGLKVPGDQYSVIHGDSYYLLARAADAILTPSFSDSTADNKYGLHIENASWGIWGTALPAFMTMDSSANTLRRAVHGANRNLTTFVASRGNYANVPAWNVADSASDLVYPSCFDDDWVLNVGGNDTAGQIASVACHGYSLDVSAPCDLPLTKSCIGTVSYYTFGGTSSAAPHVAGVAGLLMTYMNDPFNNNSYQNLAPEDVEHIIQLSATDNNIAGYDSMGGYGKLNAGKALQLVQKPSNTLYHFGTDPTANCTSTIGNPLLAYTGDTITITEPYQNIANTWFKAGKYIVNTYQIDVKFDYTLNANDTIVSYWARPSGSTTFQLFNASKKLVPHEKVIINTLDDISATTRGYCYEVFDTLGNPLGWWPSNIPSNVTDSLKVEFSILAHDKTSWANGTATTEINNNKINIYPNPSNNAQYIEILSAKVEPLSIELLDISGRKLATVFIGKTIIGNVKIPSYLSTYSAGIYQYRIQIGDSFKTIKVNKQ